MKKPLRRLSDLERSERLAAMGLGEDLMPLTLTEAERAAAQNPGEGPKEKHMKPIIPVWLATVSTALSPVLYLVSTFVPPPWGLIAFGLSFVAAFLGGLALPVPKFLAGKAVLPAFLVPIVATLVPVLVSLAQGMAPGVARHALELSAIVLTALAGLPVSVPTVKPANDNVEVVPVPKVA